MGSIAWRGLGALWIILAAVSVHYYRGPIEHFFHVPVGADPDHLLLWFVAGPVIVTGLLMLEFIAKRSQPVLPAHLSQHYD